MHKPKRKPLNKMSSSDCYKYIISEIELYCSKLENKNLKNNLNYSNNNQVCIKLLEEKEKELLELKNLKNIFNSSSQEENIQNLIELKHSDINQYIFALENYSKYLIDVDKSNDKVIDQYQDKLKQFKSQIEEQNKILETKEENNNLLNDIIEQLEIKNKSLSDLSRSNSEIIKSIINEKDKIQNNLNKLHKEYKNYYFTSEKTLYKLKTIILNQYRALHPEETRLDILEILSEYLF